MSEPLYTSPQQVFDIVARHLLAQGRKSILPRPGAGCAYRGDDGCKCAVGVLIPDEAYRPEMDHLDEAYVADVFREFPEVSDLFGFDALGLLKTLQNTHDHSDVADWPAALRIVAEAYALSPAVLDEFPTKDPV